MAISLSSSCLVIALASKRGTLRLETRNSRFGDTYVAICDERGIIEVADDMDAANARVENIRERVAA